MSALMCGRCPNTAMPKVVQGILTDPPGWSNVALTGLPMLHRVLCSGCTTELRTLLDTPPAVAERQHDLELEQAFTRGYADGQDDARAKSNADDVPA